MAKETKTIQVDPDELNEKVELWGYFGWELMGQPQRIFNKTVHEGDSNTDSSGNIRTAIITETIDYFTVTFQRDRSMPNYAELCDLEQQYYIQLDSYPPATPIEPEKNSPGCFTWGFTITFIVLGLISMVGGAGGSGLVFIVPGIAIFMISKARANSTHSKELAEWEIERADWKKRRAEWDAENANKMSEDEIIERAKTLIYAIGDDVQEDMEKAKYLFTKAAEYGHVKAQEEPTKLNADELPIQSHKEMQKEPTKLNVDEPSPNKLPTVSPTSVQEPDFLRVLAGNGRKIIISLVSLALLAGIIVIVKNFANSDAREATAEANKENNSENFPAPVPPVNIDMIFVKGGTFTMGCTQEQGKDCSSVEKHTRSVTVNDFQIGKYEVTQGQWVQVMGSNPSAFKGDDLPVENVSWNDAQEFISKLNSMSGKNYRLPTEAEWEYAARGGAKSKRYKYAGSNNIDEISWHKDNSNNRTHPVGIKLPNELGIYDMSGNVWEWVENFQEPSSGSVVERGGSWNRPANRSQVSYSSKDSPSHHCNSDGFRLAASAQNANSATPGVYPQASERLLTASDLQNISKKDLRIMRNEIFARHGYVFKSDDLKAYFKNQGWYTPKYADVNSMLTNIETKNIQFIQRYE